MASTPPQSSRLRRALVRIARSIGLIALLALALEGVARWVVASDTLFPRLTSPYDEPSWRLRWLRAQTQEQTRDQKSAQPDAQSSGMTRFSFDQHHAERGWTLAPNLRDLPVFDGERLSSNSRGLRGAREVVNPKPAGTVRIALFGDSFTFGEDVSDDETFGHQMERLFGASGQAVEVINYGVHGYGHDQMLLYAREVLALDRPDVVILGYVTDDSLRNVTTFRDYAKPRFRLVDGQLRMEGAPVPPPEQLIARERWRSRLLDLVTMATTRLAWKWSDRAVEVDRLTAALLGEIAREARAVGARPAFVLLPVWNELGVADPAPLPAEAFVLGVAARENVPCLRLRPLFLERARLGAEFEQVGHWGALEHRLAAGGIVDFLRREGLAP
jgi:hypothetical protein